MYIYLYINRNQLTLEWNKKYRKAASKSNNIKLISNSLHGLNLDNEQEIPVICGMPSKKIKWNSPESKFKNLKFTIILAYKIII